MFRNVVGRLVLKTVRVEHRPFAQTLPAARESVRRFTEAKDEARPPFDPFLLEILVCPLSKKPLRYDRNTNELINEELGIAYPIIDGIPNMIPQEARLTKKESDL